jgi:hypothetical protein
VGDTASTADRASGLMDARPRDLCDGVGDARGLEGVLSLVMTGEGLPAPRLAGERVLFAEAATIVGTFGASDPTIKLRPRYRRSRGTVTKPELDAVVARRTRTRTPCFTSVRMRSTAGTRVERTVV